MKLKMSLLFTTIHFRRFSLNYNRLQKNFLIFYLFNIPRIIVISIDSKLNTDKKEPMWHENKSVCLNSKQSWSPANLVGVTRKLFKRKTAATNKTKVV